MVSVSAPGKLMLFGEHAVVYGKHCIVTAVDKRLIANLQRSKDISINSMDYKIRNYVLDKLDKLPSELKFVSSSIRYFYDKYRIKGGVSIATGGTLKSSYGLGSSSAIIVCIIKGLAKLFRVPLPNRTLFDVSYKINRLVQGAGSGFDVASAIYGKTLNYVAGGKVIQKVKVKDLPLVIGYTGIKAHTPTIVKEVANRYRENPEYHDDIFDDIDKISLKAKDEIEHKKWRKVGSLMDKNQELLRKLGVSSFKLEEMVNAAKDAGAYGAKLSGAGVGDCMIAIPDGSVEAVKDAIKEAGGQVISIKVNADGVKAN
jgi:mevalonate kinase